MPLKPCHFIILVFLTLFVSNLRALTSFELHNIDKAHAQGYTGKGVNIGIIDSIFNPNHELLFGKFLEPPINNTYKEPTNNHGNHIAGIAAAVRTDGANYGVAYNSKIVAYGNLGMSNYYTGFGAMLTHNVRVINNSHTAFYPQFVEFARQNNSILKYRTNGTVADLYDFRGKDKSVFEPIPGGNLAINWPGTFGFDITLYIELYIPQCIY